MRKYVIGLTVLSLLAGIVYVGVRYQATVYLMPTPSVISDSEFNPFDVNPNLQKSNNLRILYATNRLPAAETEKRIYTIFPGDKLRMGVAHMQIGEKETPWQKIINLSLTADESDRPPLELKGLKELAQYPLGSNALSETDDIRALAAMVNQAFARSIDKDITIYVHGANTGIYRAAAQAAQYHHFTGQNSVVMVFLWPSAENLLGYGTDTRHARKSAPAFARLLTLLAEYTDPENINILAYSAGAQIVSPALEILGRTTEQQKRKQLRIGQVYFAAADIGVDTFATHLKSYIDIPRNTTLAINLSDSALLLSARRNRVSRAGRPDKEDLSSTQVEWLSRATMGSGLDLLEINAQTVSGMHVRSHDFWYSHPWVSSDVLTQFLFHKTPRQRGLVEMKEENKLRYWNFPQDYPQRIVAIVEELKASQKVHNRISN